MSCTAPGLSVMFHAARSTCSSPRMMCWNRLAGAEGAHVLMCEGAVRAAPSRRRDLLVVGRGARCNVPGRYPSEQHEEHDPERPHVELYAQHTQQ